MTTNSTEKKESKNDENKGEFKRKASKFREFISDKHPTYKPESGRYHLYVSYACPWAHRTIITRSLKGLEDCIGLTVVDPHIRTEFRTPEYVGWEFNDKYPDPLHKDTKNTFDLYKKSVPNHPNEGLSVPILWDKKTSKIVNNESSEIIVMLNESFNKFSKNPSLDLNPKELRDKQKEIDSWVYDYINNGVYKCGMTSSQEAYNEAYNNLFNHLDKLEEILSKQRYLINNKNITLSDIRAFTTLIRFDNVYYLHFKCNKKRIIDYPNIFGYVRELYQMPKIKETVNFSHIKDHYFKSHTMINPTGIVPLGPNIDFDAPHGRDKKY